jgi:diguanylate cyclase (GGDEF)-like protein
MPARLRRPALVIIIAALYYAGARCGLLAFTGDHLGLVRPSSGFAVSMLLLLGTEMWPGILIGAFLANVTTGEPIAVPACIAIGSALEAIVAAWLLRRFAGFKDSITSLKDAVGIVLLAAAVSTAVSATIGMTGLCLGSVQPWSAYGARWWSWWRGDAVGVLLVAPMLLTWAVWRRPWPASRTVEAIALAGALVATGGAVFGERFVAETLFHPLEYAVFPFVIWAAIRFGIAGASMTNVLVSSIAFWGTMHGLGPYADGQLEDRLLLLQLFVGVVAATGLLLGALITERDASARRRHAEYLRDITEQKRVMSQLSFQAAHDGLTTLLNRAAFLERLGAAARRERDPDGCFMALLFVDVDRFKAINDRLGHLAGDRLLVTIARKLQASVRPGDIVARLGGDEFAILLECLTDVRDATAAADRIQTSLRLPIDLEGHRVVATASIGIALSTPGDQPEDMLQTADAAMYHSKAIGPSRYNVIDRRQAHAREELGAHSNSQMAAGWSCGSHPVARPRGVPVATTA